MQQTTLTLNNEEIKTLRETLGNSLDQAYQTATDLRTILDKLNDPNAQVSTPQVIPVHIDETPQPKVKVRKVYQMNYQKIWSLSDLTSYLFAAIHKQPQDPKVVSKKTTTQLNLARKSFTFLFNKRFKAYSIDQLTHIIGKTNVAQKLLHPRTKLPVLKRNTLTLLKKPEQKELNLIVEARPWKREELASFFYEATTKSVPELANQFKRTPLEIARAKMKYGWVFAKINGLNNQKEVISELLSSHKSFAAVTSA